MRKPINSSVPEELITRMDESVTSSKGGFRDRSHLVEQAIKYFLGDDLSRPGSDLAKSAVSPNLNPSSSLYESSLFPRLSIHMKEKQAVAEEAAGLVEAFTTLFLDGSTTCIELAKILAQQKKGLTIVTNSALVCLELGHSLVNRVIGIGGEFDARSASFIGANTEEIIKQYYVDYAFMSTKGFIPGEGTFESTMGTLRIKQIIAEHCGKLILLIDHSKFGQRSLCKVLDVSQVQTIVTDWQAPQDALDQLHTAGRDVRVAPPQTNCQEGR